MMSDLHRALALFLCSVFLAVGSNALRPDRLDWYPDLSKSKNPGENPALVEKASISLEDVLARLNDGTATFVDARKPERFAEGHLAGAINLPAATKLSSFSKAYPFLPKEGLIIIYCGGGKCEESNEVFEFLASSGFEMDNLRVFKPGWEVLGRQPNVPVEEGGGQ